MRFLFPLIIAVLGAAQAACTPAQDQQAAQATARNSAQSQLGHATFALNLLYRDITYSVDVGPATVKGGSASVPGTVILRGTERRTGKPAQGSYPGTVFLQRAGACEWKFSSYKRS